MSPVLLPEGSLETVKSELQIFDRPDYQVSQLSGGWIEYKPQTSCVGTDVGTPIIIDVPEAEGMYTDLGSYGDPVPHSFQSDTDQAPVALSSSTAPKLALVNQGLCSFAVVAIGCDESRGVEGDSQLYAYKA